MAGWLSHLTRKLGPIASLFFFFIYLVNNSIKRHLLRVFLGSWATESVAAFTQNA